MRQTSFGRTKSFFSVAHASASLSTWPVALLEAPPPHMQGITFKSAPSPCASHPSYSVQQIACVRHAHFSCTLALPTFPLPTFPRQPTVDDPVCIALCKHCLLTFTLWIICHLSRVVCLFLLFECNGTACAVKASFLVVRVTSSVMLKVLNIARTAGLVMFQVLFAGEAVTHQQFVGYAVTLLGFAGYVQETLPTENLLGGTDGSRWPTSLIFG